VRAREHILVVAGILLMSALLGLAIYGFGMLFFVNK